jgi:uncharacterized membrane protein YeaQ/YmgE (transglycosylase-associated protein family)
MTIFADLVLEPGGLVAWIFVGLIAGWLAGHVMKGSGYGVVGDVVVGLVGALLGGIVFGSMQSSFVLWSAGFWGSILVAFLGALILLAAVRFMTSGRSA